MNKEENFDSEELLSWIDARFVKSFVKIHCLAQIAAGHKHGYDIMKHIDREYDVKISAGTYYPVLQWLEDNGYITGSWEDQPEGKPDRRTYEVTKKGRELLATTKKRLGTLVGGFCAEKCVCAKKRK